MFKNYSSERVELRRPPINVSAIQMLAGTLLLLMVLAALSANYGLIQDAYATTLGFADLLDLGNEAEMLFGALYVLTLFLYLLLLIPAIFITVTKGISYIIKGLSEIVTPWMPANIPSRFGNYRELVIGFKEQTLSIYQILDPFISGFFGKNTMFLSPTRRDVVVENAKSMRSRLTNIFLIAALLGCMFISSRWLVSNVMNELAADFDVSFLIATLLDSGGAGSVSTPVLLLIVAQLVVGGIELISNFMLVPRRQPSTSVYEGAEHFRGFGHPSQLFTRLPDLASPLKWEEFPNRVYQEWDEEPSKAVGDVGEFSGYIIIEQQPQPLPSSGNFASYFLLLSGWGLILIGAAIVLFLLLPSQVRGIGSSYAFQFIFAPFYVIFMGLVVISLINNGQRFRRQAEKMLQSARFRSQAILINLAGTLSRADVKVGKSIADSIESSSLIARSDFTASFWSGELISEAATLDAQRDLLALNQTQLALEWIGFFKKEIDTLREEGVRPVGVDLQSAEVQEIVRANIDVSALRSGAEERAQLKAAQEGADQAMLTEESSRDVDQPDIKLLGTSESSQFDESQFKECPDCAEIIRIKARKCRFCGYRFDKND